MENGLPKRVILTDDPLRVRMLVAHHVTYARLISEQRGMCAYAGEYEGVMLAIIAVGYGESSLLAWLGEAIELGVEEAAFIGECVSQDSDLKLMDVVLATEADGSRGKASPAPELLAGAISAAKDLSIPARQLEVFTDDTYWLDDEPAQRSGKLAIDFSTNAFYHKAALEDVSALSVLTVSENALTGRRIDEAQRQSRFYKAARLAFKALKLRAL
jgi:purine-nucleoside phosphorylase